MSDLNGDLNATIANAVNARIEASVLEALSGDEVLGRYVAAALNQEVDTRDYRNRKTTFLKHTLDAALREATKAAVNRVLADEQEAIETEIRKALRRNLAGMAEQIARSLSERASKGYGVTVELRVPGDER